MEDIDDTPEDMLDEGIIEIELKIKDEDLPTHNDDIRDHDQAHEGMIGQHLVRSFSYFAKTSTEIVVFTVSWFVFASITTE